MSDSRPIPTPELPATCGAAVRLHRLVGHRVSWFSAGASSAVATKLVAHELDQIIYVHIDDQHPDSMRFVRCCGRWFGKPITILQSGAKDVAFVISKERYVNGANGAPCTRALKTRVRQKWEQENVHLYPMQYIWGMDASEQHRADRICQTMPEFDHRFPLIENRISKAEAHEILYASGIRRPAMYELGYHNNNCIGCVKGGMGYWNKIRKDFPEVFESRARLEREIGASCIKGVFLDELAPDAGRHEPPIDDDCGIMCELQALKTPEQPSASPTMPNDRAQQQPPAVNVNGKGSAR